MAKQLVGIGAAPNDGTGDPLRNAMTKINENFTELYDGQFDGAFTSLTGRPTSLLYWVNDGSDGQVLTTNGDGTITFEDPTNVSGPVADQQILNTQTLGRLNSSDQYIPFTITETISSTLQDAIPATNVVDGNIEKLVYTKELDRYTSGGELLLTFICNTGNPKVYSTRKFIFSRNESETFDVLETGVGSDDIYNGIEITERTVNTDLFLDVTVTAPNSGIASQEFVRVVGQITYTSVPIFLTASGY